MSMVTLRPTRPHAAQQSIIDSQALHKVADCGRRFGKTEMFASMLGLGHGRGLYKGAVEGYPIAYWSLTYKNVQEMWERLKTLYAPLISKKNETLKVLDFFTGGRIECWSTEKASAARGRAYAGIIVDEAGWTVNLMQTWQDDLQPMLVDYAGWVVFGGTPNGTNDYHTMFNWGQDPEKKLWESWQFPSTANPHIPADYLEQIRVNVPQRTWQQEYEGIFLSDGGAVFRNLKACIIQSLTLTSRENIIFGVDLGRSNDYTVITVMDADSLQVLDIDRFSDIGWEIQRGRLLAKYQQWKPYCVVIEENFNDSFAERLKADGLPIVQFRTTSPSKQQIINSLALAFEQTAIGIPDNPTLLAELQAYTIEKLPSGTFRYSAPSGLHDDMVMSLAFALYGVTHNPTLREIAYPNFYDWNS